MLLAVTLTSLAAGALMIWLRKALAGRFDPNEGFPAKRPNPIPGMPPALKALPAQAGEPTALAVADPRPPQIENGWLTVQMPRVVWPPHCGNCMGVAETTFRRRFRLSQHDNSLPLPVCRCCAKSLARRSWLWAFLALPLTFAGLALGILPLPTGDRPERSSR